jgi:hypothetical protein
MISASPLFSGGLMRARLLAAATLLTLAATAVSAAAAGATTYAGFNRETYQYSTSMTTSQEANSYQVLVLQASNASWIPLLKAANPNLKVLVYQAIMAAQDQNPQSITCTTGPTDLASNPSWILKDQNGNPILTNGHYLMDVGNSGYQQACAANAIATAKQGGFDGVYWDMVNASLSYTLPSGTSVPEYPSVASWQTAMGSMLNYVGPTLQSNGLLAVGNLGGVASYSGLWQQWMAPLAGGEEESWTDGKLGLAQQVPYWPAKLADAAWSEANGKIEIVHSWNTSDAGNTYGLASMLLVAGGHLSYSTSNSCYTTCETWYPEYTTAQQLGAPTGAYTKLSNGVYERLFQNGLVLVNPTTTTVPTFSLPGGTYTGSGLTSVSSVSMAPTVGLILLADSNSSGITVPPANTSAPAITGTAAVGSALTASPGSWSGTPTPTVAYQWQRCTTSSLSSCAAISGATAGTYTVQSADAGDYLDVVATATNSAGVASAPSAESAQVPVSTTSAPANTALPAVSGTAKDGGTLTASTGTWSGNPAPSYSYQWERCSTSCAAISGATGSTYAVQLADAGYRLAVVVTAASSGSIGVGQYTWTIADISGFTGLVNPVTMSISGLPAGATASFNSATTTYQDLLNIWTSKTSPKGTYNLVVTGTDGGVTRSTTLTLTLT